MDITGKIIAVLPTRSGTSAKGTQWSSQTAVIETHEQYPKKVAFDVLGERITENGVGNGISIVLTINILSRMPSDISSLFGQFVSGKPIARGVVSVTVSFDINARGFNGKWFNSVNAWKVVREQVHVQGCYNTNPQSGAQAAQAAQPSAAIGAANPMNPLNPFPPAQQQGAPAGKADSLPF